MSIQSIDFRRAAYARKKRQRLAKQDADMARILGLEEDEQPDALFERWPQSIPARLRSNLVEDVYFAWGQLVGQRSDRKFAQSLPKMAELSRIQVLEDIGEEGLRRHGVEIKALLDRILALKGNKSLMLMLDESSLGGEGARSNIYMDLIGPPTEDILEQIRTALASMFMLGGQLLINQTLPMRSQQRDAEGNLVWTAQERIYGAVMFEGQWRSLDESRLRTLYGTDPLTGIQSQAATGLHFAQLSS